MRYIYRGPWQWVTEGGLSFWCVPWSIGCLDMRSIPEQSQRGGTPGLGIFMATSPISDSNYDLLGTGNWHDIKPDQRGKDSLPKPKKYAVKGDDLVGMLLDLLTDAADPTGSSFVKPLIPTANNKLELCLGGYRFTESFSWGNARTSKIKDAIRLEFQQVFDGAKAGKLKDAEHHLRVLDAYCEKYGVEDFKEFVPPAIQKDVPGPKKHETTITDSFDRANADALGTSSEGWSWTETEGDIDILSNQAKQGAAGAECIARAESDLSSSDLYSQADVSGGFPGVGARYSSSAKTYYFAQWISNWQIRKYVAGAFTSIANSGTSGPPTTVKLTCNGSSLEVFSNGVSQVSATDTAISGNLRCGIHGFSGAETWDNFQAADLAGSTVKYTQLERSTRGYQRGKYTRY